MLAVCMAPAVAAEAAAGASEPGGAIAAGGVEAGAGAGAGAGDESEDLLRLALARRELSIETLGSLGSSRRRCIVVGPWRRGWRRRRAMRDARGLRRRLVLISNTFDTDVHPNFVPAILDGHLLDLVGVQSALCLPRQLDRLDGNPIVRTRRLLELLLDRFMESNSVDIVHPMDGLSSAVDKESRKQGARLERRPRLRLGDDNLLAVLRNCHSELVLLALPRKLASNKVVLAINGLESTFDQIPVVLEDAILRRLALALVRRLCEREGGSKRCENESQSKRSIQKERKRERTHLQQQQLQQHEAEELPSDLESLEHSAPASRALSCGDGSRGPQHGHIKQIAARGSRTMTTNERASEESFLNNRHTNFLTVIEV